MVKKYKKYTIGSNKDEYRDFGLHYEYCRREGIPYVGIEYHGKYAYIRTDYYLNAEEEKIFGTIIDDNGFTHELLINLGIAKKLDKNNRKPKKLSGWNTVSVCKEYAEKIAEKVFDRFFECMQYAREEVKRRKQEI